MQRNFLLCWSIWQLMYAMESKIIQPFRRSMCPAPKSCHPSQCSVTCNLFCLRLPRYVSVRINCIVRFSRVPAASASAPSFAAGLISDATSVFKGIGHWAGFILFLESFLLSFSAVSHWELLQDCRQGRGRAGCAVVGVAPDPARAGAPRRPSGCELGAAGSPSGHGSHHDHPL